MKSTALVIIIALSSICCSYHPENAVLTGGVHTANTAATPLVVQQQDPTYEQWNIYRNDVNGVAIGSDPSDVIRQFGKPSSIKKGGENPCGGKKSVLRYPGIEFTLDQDDRKLNIVVVIEISSPNWSMSPGIQTGLSLEEVRSKMGRSGTYTKNGGVESLGYGDGDGYLNFYFKRGKLVKIVRDLNLC